MTRSFFVTVSSKLSFVSAIVAMQNSMRIYKDPPGNARFPVTGSLSAA
jgi:hypothetical protein